MKIADQPENCWRNRCLGKIFANRIGRTMLTDNSAAQKKKLPVTTDAVTGSRIRLRKKSIPRLFLGGAALRRLCENRLFVSSSGMIIPNKAPAGRLIIARRFNAGISGKDDPSPVGTTELSHSLFSDAVGLSDLAREKRIS